MSVRLDGIDKIKSTFKKKLSAIKQKQILEDVGSAVSTVWMGPPLFVLFFKSVKMQANAVK